MKKRLGKNLPEPVDSDLDETNDLEEELSNSTARSLTLKPKMTTVKKKIKMKRSASESLLVSEFIEEQQEQDTLTSRKLTKSTSNRDLTKDENGNTFKTYFKNNNLITIYDSVPKEHQAPLHIINQDQAKKKFLEKNVPPQLKFKAGKDRAQFIIKNQSKVRYENFFKAKRILDLVTERFPKGVFAYYEANFGPKIDSEDCVRLVGKYLSANNIDGEIKINFAPGLTCSGRITYHGMENNDPTTRQYIVWINNDRDNQFLREEGIVCLCDHELGTHYYRGYNDGLQVWFRDRKRWGLRPMSSRELVATEEGLAALNTLQSANLKYLYLPALLYYLACMASRMTFEQLFNHMEKYIASPEERWKLVTRVKRGITDPKRVGCYSRDQCYFEGAIEILENLDEIDFNLLMCGKICVDELEVVKDVAHTDKLKIPKFLKNTRAYKIKLRQIGIANEILGPNGRVDDQATEEDVRRYIKNEINEVKNVQVSLPRMEEMHQDFKNVDANNSSLCTVL